MLELAILHEEEIKNRYMDCINYPEYKHHNRSGWCDLVPKIYPDNYNIIQYASTVNYGYGPEVIGLLEAEITRPSNSVNITVMHFNYECRRNIMTFSKDMMSFVKYLFEYKKFNKIKIRCRESNPALEKYKKLIPKFGGKCIGISELDEMDEDGTLQNVHMFEVLRERYLEAINLRKEKIAAAKIAKVHEDVLNQGMMRPAKGPLHMYTPTEFGRKSLHLRWEHAINAAKHIAYINKDSRDNELASTYVDMFEFLIQKCPFNYDIEGESGYITVKLIPRKEEK